MQQAGMRDGGGAYEVASVSLLNGDPWNPMKNADSENHPGVLSFRIQLTSRELIVNLERNDRWHGIPVSGISESKHRYYIKGTPTLTSKTIFFPCVSHY
ncbi:hypothetical protein G4228_010721 [Cervus hanglu yarkandensis]|nr:hypothetical protein G4228_010721 [Cervus hanglu yarkandensis]